jgi:hypothetical protein
MEKKEKRRPGRQREGNERIPVNVNIDVDLAKATAGVNRSLLVNKLLRTWYNRQKEKQDGKG